MCVSYAEGRPSSPKGSNGIVGSQALGLSRARGTMPKSFAKWIATELLRSSKIYKPTGHDSLNDLLDGELLSSIFGEILWCDPQFTCHIVVSQASGSSKTQTNGLFPQIICQE